jgi:hypothetical protein
MQGTTFKLTQFGKVIGAFSEALAIVVEDMDPKAALAAVTNKCDKLAVYIRLIFMVLMTTDQELALVKREEEIKPPVLEFVTTVAVGEVKDFEVITQIRKDNPDGVKVSDVSSSFQKVFGKKTERDVCAATLRIHRLSRGVKDPEIIVALGNKHSALLAHLWELVKLQSNGPASAPGVLLTNGWANILEVPDDKGVLWSVCACWRVGGWYFHADPLGNPDEWCVGDRVVSC